MHLITKPHPFTHQAKFAGKIPNGESVAQIVDRIDVDPVIREIMVVQLDGRIVPKTAWHFTFPKESTAMTVVAVPRGGDGNKGIIASIAMIALLFAAPMLAGGINTAFGLGLGKAGLAKLAAGITLVGSLIMTALFKPSSPEDYGGESFTFTGQSNQVRKDRGLMRIFGTNKVYPDVVALPYTMASGGYDDLFMILGFGYGLVEIEDLRIGNTPLANFDGVEYIIHQSWTTGDGLHLYPDDVDTQEFSVVLEHDDAHDDAIPADEWMTLETADDCDWARLEVAFPTGLIEEEANKNNPHAYSVEFCLQWRPMEAGVGVGDWQGLHTVNHSFSDVRHSDGKGIYDIGDSFGDHEYFANYDRHVRLGNVNGYAFLALYVNAGSTTIPIKTTNYIPEGSTIMIDSVKYLTTAGAAAGSEVNVGITPALRQDLDLGRLLISIVNPAVYAWFPETVHHFLVDGCGFRVRYKTRVPFTAGISMYFPDRDRYELRIGRTTWYEEGHQYQSDTTAVRNLKSVTTEPPIDIDVPITIMELKIRASKQLNGVLDNVNAICHANIPVWNGSEWVTQRSSTPAWAYAEVIRGDANKHNISDDYVDIPRLEEWAAMTDAPISDRSLGHVLGNLNADREEVVGVDGEKAYYQSAGNNIVPVVLTGIPQVGDTIRLDGAPYLILAADDGDAYTTGEVEIKITPSLTHELYLGAEYYDAGTTSMVFQGVAVSTADERPYLGFNAVLAGDTTVLNLLQQIASCGKASPTVRDSKYSVAFDREQEAVQMFTQRNSKDMTMRMRFVDQPHGIRCQFVDRTEDYQNGEIIAYADGYARHTVELNPDPDLDGSATWSFGTGWSRTTGYIATDGATSSGSVASVTAVNKIETGIRYRVTFEIYDYVSGAVWCGLKGESDTEWFEEAQTVDVYVAAEGEDNAITFVAEENSEFKIRNIAIGAVSATRIEDLQLFGCDDPSQAWRMGRYHMAQGILRPETYWFTVDVENIACERGDRVLLAYDVPSAGGIPSRIVSTLTEDGDVVGIKIDEAVYFDDDVEYVVAIRTETIGQIHTVSVTAGATPFHLMLGNRDLDGILIGNLVVFGEAQQVVADFIVSEIHPAQSLSAKLVCVPYAENINDAESGVMPVYQPLITAPRKDEQPAPVYDLDGQYHVSYIEQQILVDFTLTWEIGDASNLDSFQIWWVSNETGAWTMIMDGIHGTTATIRPITDQGFISADVFDQTHQFAVVAVNYNQHGIPAAVAPSVGIYVPPASYFTDVPPDIEGFTIDSSKDQSVLTWTKPDTQYIDHYELRYIPDIPAVRDDSPYLTPYWECLEDPYFEDFNTLDSWVLSDTTNMKIGGKVLTVSGGQSAGVTASIDLDLGSLSGVTYAALVFTIVSISAGNARAKLGVDGTLSAGVTTVGTHMIEVENWTSTTKKVYLRFDSTFIGVVTNVRGFTTDVSKQVGETWERASHVVENIPLSANSITIPFRRGTYFLKGFNPIGLESDNAASIHTTLRNEFEDTLLAKRLNAFPFVDGTKQNLHHSAASDVILSPNLVRDEGYYVFPDIIEFDKVFEFDISSFPFVDHDSNWFYDLVQEGYGGRIEVQISYAKDELVMADWDSTVDPTNFPNELGSLTALDQTSDWSEWTTFTRGRFIGKYFRFRLKYTKPFSPLNQNVDIHFEEDLSYVSAVNWYASDTAITKTGDNKFHVDGTQTAGCLLMHGVQISEIWGGDHVVRVKVENYQVGSLTVRLDSGDLTKSVSGNGIFELDAVAIASSNRFILNFSVDFIGEISMIEVLDYTPPYVGLIADNVQIDLRIQEHTLSGFGANTTTATSGTVIYFPSSFIKPPKVTASHVAGDNTTQYVVDILSVTESSFTVLVHSVAAGTGVKTIVAGTVDWTAIGFGQSLDNSEIA